MWIRKGYPFYCNQSRELRNETDTDNGSNIEELGVSGAIAIMDSTSGTQQNLTAVPYSRFRIPGTTKNFTKVDDLESQPKSPPIQPNNGNIFKKMWNFFIQPPGALHRRRSSILLISNGLLEALCTINLGLFAKFGNKVNIKSESTIDLTSPLTKLKIDLGLSKLHISSLILIAALLYAYLVYNRLYHDEWEEVLSDQPAPPQVSYFGTNSILLVYSGITLFACFVIAVSR